MLLGYGARNCWCFKDWLDIDFRLNGYVPENITQNRNYATVLGFEGANASGKTNALKVLGFIREFVLNSFRFSVDQRIPFDTFFFNEEKADFYVEFAINSETEFRYEASMTTSKVFDETLFEIKDGSESIILKREEDRILENSLYDTETRIILRDNASVISTLNQYGVKEVNDICSLFRNVATNVSYSGLNYVIDSVVELVSFEYNKDRNALSFAKDLIKRFDTGVEDIQIKHFNDEEKKKDIYYPYFIHTNNKKKVGLGFGFESSGTKALFSHLIDYYYALLNGGILVLDEFDINIHPDIVPHLIDLFGSKETNKYGAQMIFTSLNPTVMDILGRYRTYLFEKENGESFAYRLDEPDTNILRNDRSISAPYRKHLIGGYPKIEA